MQNVEQNEEVVVGTYGNCWDVLIKFGKRAGNKVINLGKHKKTHNDEGTYNRRK